MASSQKIEKIKMWTPWIASAVIIIFSLIIFWGIVDFAMKFLGASSYFIVPTSDDSLTSNSIKERNDKMDKFIKERFQMRQNASSNWVLSSEEKDPFNLP